MDCLCDSVERMNESITDAVIGLQFSVFSVLRGGVGKEGSYVGMGNVISQ